MTVVKNSIHIHRYIGLSTDTKPTTATHDTQIGSTFYEYNTGIMYITYDGTNWVVKGDISLVHGDIAVVSTTQAVAAAGDYGVNDVLCNNATTGVPWNFPNVVAAVGRGGYITDVQITVETTAQAHRLALDLYSETPTSELDDNVTNTGPADADRGFYICRLIFPALESLGVGNSQTSISMSTIGGLPRFFTCAAADVDLYGILITLDAFTNETVDDEYKITMTIART